MNIFDLGIKTTYDGVDEARKAVSALRHEMDKAEKLDIKVSEKDLSKAKNHLIALERSIKEAEKTGGDFSTIFSTQLKKIQGESAKTSTSIKGVDRSLKSLDKTAKGGSGFGAISKSAKIATRDIYKADTQLDKLKTNLQQGVGQTIAFAGIGAITGSAMKIISDVSKLDEITTNISIVSGKSADEMERYQAAAQKTADTLGTLGSKYLEASLIYEQQGGEAAYYANELAQSTVVAANISQESTSQMSEYLTATINGFQLLKEKGGEAGTYITDVLAKLGAASGSDLAEIATGLTRTANTAKDAKFEFEEIATMIATVSEVTRRTPETIGNAFKSMLTSFTQLREASDKEVEEFTSKVEKAFQLAGINDEISIFDEGNLRDASDIFKDIASKWDTMTTESQALVSEAVAGKYQAEVFRAFMNNQERYNNLLDTAYNSAGTAAMQQIIYMDSLKAKTEQVGNAWEGVSSTILDSDAFGNVLEQVSSAFKIISNTESSLVAISRLISPLIGLFANSAGKNLGGALGDQLWGSASSYKNISKELMAIEGISEEAKQRKLEEIKIGERQTELRDQMTEADAMYYENVLSAQEKLNEKLGEQSRLLQEASTEEGFNSIVEEVATRGGAGGLTTDDFKKARLEGEAEARAALVSEEQKIVALRKEAGEISKKQISNWDVREKKAIERRLKELQITRQDQFTKEEIQSIEERRAELTKKIGKIHKNDSQSLVKIKEQAKALADEIYSGEQKVAEELKEQANEAERLLNAKIKQAGLDAGAGVVRQGIEGVEKDLEAQREELVTLEAERRAIEKSYLAKQRLQKAIKGTMVGFSALVPVIGAVKSAMDGTIEVSDAVTASMSNLGMTLTTTGMMSGNAIVMGVGVAMTAVSQLGKQFGWFETQAEKTKKANDSLVRSFMSMDEQIGQKMDLLQSVEKSYKDLQGYSGAELLSATTDGMSEEEAKALNETQREYLELSEKIATVAPELVQYYDEKGRAIVDLSLDYDKLLDKMKEEQTLTSEIFSKNATAFSSEISGTMDGAVEKISKANEKLAQLEEKRRKLQSQEGKEKQLASVIADIQEQNQIITESTEILTQSAADIQSKIVKPYFDANRGLKSLAESNKELYGQLASFAGEHMNVDVLTQALSSGDSNAAKRTQENLDLIIEKVRVLNEESPEKGQEFLDRIVGSSEKAKLVIQDKVFRSVEEIESAIEAQEGAYASATRGALEYAKAVEEGGDKLERVHDLQVSGSPEAQKSIEEARRKEAQEGYILLLDAEEARQNNIKALEKELKLEGELSKKKKDKLDSLRKESEIAKKDIAEREAIMNSEDTTEKDIENIEKYLDGLGDLEETLGEVQDAFHRGATSAEGFNESIEEVSSMESTIQELSELQKAIGNMDSASPLSSLKDELERIGELAPEIKDKLDEIYNSTEDDNIKRAEMLDLISSTSEVALANYGAAAAGMMEADNNVFINWQNQNLEKLTLIDEIYDINIANAASYQEAMEQLQTLDPAALEDTREIMISSAEDVQKRIAEEEQKSVDDKKKKEKEKSELVLNANMLAHLNTIETNGDIAKSYHEMSLQSQEAILGIAKAWDKITGKKTSSGIAKAIKEQANEDIDAKTQELITVAKEREEKFQSEVKKLEKQSFSMDKNIASIWGAGAISSAGGFTSLAPKQKTAAEIAAEAKQRRAEEEEARQKDAREKAEKDKKERESKDIELQINEYIKLDNKLKDVTNSMSDLAIAKDMAYGKDKIDLMTREQALLRQQASLSGQYVRQLEGEQGRLRGKLTSKGFTFSGKDLTNQNEKLKAMEVQVNAIADPDAKDKAKEELQKLQKDLDRYNEVTYNLIPDRKRAQEEARKAISQLARQKVEYDLSIKVDRLGIQRDVLNVVKEFHEGFDGIDERMQLSQKTAQSHLEEIALLQKQLRDISRNSDLSDSDRKEMENNAKKQLISAVGAAKQAQKEIENLQKEFLDSIGDSLSKVEKNYERVIKKATQMRDLTKSIHGNKNIAEIRQYYDIQEKAIESSIDTQQKLLNKLIDYRNTLDKGSEAWDIANEKVNELADNIETNLTAKMEVIENRWKDFMDGLMEQTDRAFGVWGLDGAREEYDKLVQSQEEYLSGMGKLTSIGAKISEINKEIAETQDPVRAKELTEYRDKELASLMAQDKVSKAEYERAMKLYEIKQKELAMKERENASRVAQLVRDESGNMTYEFIRAEDGELSKDFEELQKMKEDLMEFDEKQMQAAGSKIFDIIGNYQKQVRDLAEKGLSPEEYEKELNKILKQAQTDIDAQQSIVEKWLTNLGTDGSSALKDLFSEGVLNPEDIGLTESELTSFFSGLETGQIKISDMLAGDTSDFANALGIEPAEANEKMQAIMELVIGGNGAITDALIDASNIWTDTAQTNVDLLGKEYAKYIGEADATLKRYNATTTELNALLNKTNESSKEVIKTIDKQTEMMNKTTRATKQTSASVNELEKMLIGNGSGGLFGSMVQLQNNMNKKLQPSLQLTEKDVYKVRDASYDGARKMNMFGNESDFAYRRTKQFAGQPIKESNNQINIMGRYTETVYKNFTTMGDNAVMAQRKVVDLANELRKLPGAENILSVTGAKIGPVASMASGGYTGTWNNSTGNKEGRMALLHEKELVLNKDDTRNILEAVNIQRKMVNSMSGRNEGTRNIIRHQTSNKKYITNNESKQIIETSPVINANFPDVRDSAQIERAFEGLFAKATTFVGK